MRIPSGSVNRTLAFVAVDSVDLKTRKTALTSFTVYRSRNGGAATAYTTPTITELSAANMPGVYVLTVDEDTTITAGLDEEEYVVHITQATMAPVTRAVELYRVKATEGNTLDVNATGGAEIGTFQTGAITAAAFTAGAIDNAAFNVTETLTANPAAGGIVAASFGVGAIDNAAFNVTETLTANPTAGGIAAASFAAGAIDAAAIGADAITAAKIANGAIDAATFAAGAIDAAAIATGAIDADAIALDAANEIVGGVSGTADSGTTTTIVDTERTEADADYWKGSLVTFTSGTLNGQTRLITGFNAATDTITFAPATTVTVGTHTYRLIPSGRSDLQLWQGTAPNALIAGRIDGNTQALAAAVIASGSFAVGAIDNAAFNVTETLTANPAAGGIVAASFGAGAIDAAAIATDAIGAVELASGAVDKIVNAVWDETTAELRVAATYGQLLKDNINATVSSRAVPGDLMGLVASGITAAKFAAGAIDAAAIGTGAIDADALAADTITAAKIAVDAIGATEISSAAANKIADQTLRRTYANARLSADGDAVNFRSLLGSIGKLVNKWSISGATLTVFQEDDLTSTAPGGTQAVTGTAGANPITALDTT